MFITSRESRTMCRSHKLGHSISQSTKHDIKQCWVSDPHGEKPKPVPILHEDDRKVTNLLAKEMCMLVILAKWPSFLAFTFNLFMLQKNFKAPEPTKPGSGKHSTSSLPRCCRANVRKSQFCFHLTFDPLQVANNLYLKNLEPMDMFYYCIQIGRHAKTECLLSPYLSSCWPGCLPT